jgi:dTDP-4-dehydrorhamnose 3,5-epimerase
MRLKKMKFKRGDIDGVIIQKLTVHNDERGFLVEIYRSDNLPEGLNPEMGYVSFTKPGIFRGPHEHLYQTDIFCFIGPGSFRAKLWDNRENSKTRNNCIEIIGGEDNPILLIVPAQVVHGYKNISTEQGMVINCPNQLYKGWQKKEEVDEIRHEDYRDEFYLDFIREDK